jgi:excisionase family DNA binding protein
MDYLTVIEAAATLGISTARVSLLIKEGRIKATRYGNKMYMVDPQSVELYRQNPYRDRTPHVLSPGRPPGPARKKPTKKKSRAPLKISRDLPII